MPMIAAALNSSPYFIGIGMANQAALPTEPKLTAPVAMPTR